jgi:hypothetical protein
MAMMIELWGEESLSDTPEDFKQRIRELPPIWWERKTYLMHEYQNIVGYKWSFEDYKDIGVTHNV